VTSHPNAEWTAEPLREAFPWDSAPRSLLRDRDRTIGSDSTRQVKELGIQEVLEGPRAPQQRAYIERVIGECLDHVIVFNEAALQRHLIGSWSIITPRELICRWRRTRPASRLVEPPEDES
jgi:hypothetical protein